MSCFAFHFLPSSVFLYLLTCVLIINQPLCIQVFVFHSLFVKTWPCVPGCWFLFSGFIPGVRSTFLVCTLFCGLQQTALFDKTRLLFGYLHHLPMNRYLRLHWSILLGLQTEDKQKTEHFQYHNLVPMRTDSEFIYRFLYRHHSTHPFPQTWLVQLQSYPLLSPPLSPSSPPQSVQWRWKRQINGRKWFRTLISNMCGISSDMAHFIHVNIHVKVKQIRMKKQSKSRIFDDRSVQRQCKKGAVWY